MTFYATAINQILTNPSPLSPPFPAVSHLEPPPPRRDGGVLRGPHRPAVPAAEHASPPSHRPRGLPASHELHLRRAGASSSPSDHGGAVDGHRCRALQLLRRLPVRVGRGFQQNESRSRWVCVYVCMCVRVCVCVCLCATTCASLHLHLSADPEGPGRRGTIDNFTTNVWAVGKSFGHVPERIRRPRPPRVSYLRVKQKVSTRHR